MKNIVVYCFLAILLGFTGTLLLELAGLISVSSSVTAVGLTALVASGIIAVFAEDYGLVPRGRIGGQALEIRKPNRVHRRSSTIGACSTVS